MGVAEAPLPLCRGSDGCGLPPPRPRQPPAEGAGAQRLSSSRPPLGAAPLPCVGFVPGDVGMLGKEEEEKKEEGKGARLPPPPVEDSPLAGAQGLGGGAGENLA